MDFFTNSVAEPAKATAAKFGISTIVLYILVLALVGFVVAMLMNVKLSLSWLIPKKYTVKAVSHKFWLPSGEYSNLVVPSTLAPVPTDNAYTMMLEGLLFNSRNYQTTDGPYRHLTHRGSNELAPTSSTTSIGCSMSGTNTNLPPFGLPKRLNPGIFLDPNTNDILVFVDTTDGKNTYRESVRIADVPLDIPFSLGIVVNGRVLEVYLNCGLEATKVLTGDPSNVENVWYGLSGSASADAQIQNLTLWDYGLPADDFRAVCEVPKAFSKLRPQCNGTDKLALPAKKPAAQPSQDLGINAQLATC
jgi:hypothetical protein